MDRNDRQLNFASSHLRLRGDASTEVLPVDAGFWPRLAAGQLGSFRGEFLVGSGDFDRDWQSWERHPNGDEIVCLLSGAVDVVLEQAPDPRIIALRQVGDYVLVPKGVWHTARVRQPSSLLFITPGEGTEHRPADALSAETRAE